MRAPALNKSIWWGWGLLDVLYLLDYGVSSILRGDLPFYSDALSAMRLIDDHGDYAIAFVALGWALQLSIIASSILLMRRSVWGQRLVWLQLPLRLFLFAPSVSALLSYAGFHFTAGSVQLIALVVVTELVKVWSLWFFRSAR
ncbi:hypothetical protein [Pseudomonas entomophila]|uniref:Arginine:ornithine antiporter n=1 Tax=Pseudomonas entomophila TaxID=312306 RepID=A0ABY9QU91_9PSED|nr:hypothetical protein [Pseudomonas entomophila]WMW06660.1 hypothetical protein RAH46_04800 [Pseudomonas entomophila]